MARPRQPIDLLVYKGKKNLTKQEVEERKSQEIKAPNDKIKAPTYLPKDLRRKFKKISDELVEIGIMSNLDVDALARYLLSEKMYWQVTETLLDTSPTKMETFIKTDQDGNVVESVEDIVSNDVYTDLLVNQDKLFKQCRQAASDLGLTITSRCKLVVPKKEEGQPKTTAEKKFGSRL
ncbi:phage terminase small subunit P27 family [Bacillus cereus group sp. BfR-BA-01380]|uniref:phage terminase small subunit P27 family n=1 Tax=Bacillus cereus group sp. BfR-BA-01380 TaxID=2920324 RepID=UPI001F5AEA2B|nr:phage terminase small subunit P27 family [Bacillus cereus group sp. BfR-BA-01380]